MNFFNCFIFLLLSIITTKIAFAEKNVAVVNINDDVGSKISNGQEAKPHQFPWHVLYGFYYEHLYGRVCGAVLIDAYWALVAAKCVCGFPKIIAGYLNYSDPLAAPGSVMVEIEKTIKYQEYYNGSHDIALLRFKSPLNESDSIKYAKLPSKNLDFNGKHGITVGHGILNVENPNPPEILQYTELQLNTSLEYRPNICATEVYNKSNICIGDNGGLILKDTNIVVGLTHSLTEECGVSQKSYFTDVRLYLDWIKEHTGLGSD